MAASREVLSEPPKPNPETSEKEEKTGVATGMTAMRCHCYGTKLKPGV